MASRVTPAQWVAIGCAGASAFLAAAQFSKGGAAASQLQATSATSAAAAAPSSPIPPAPAPVRAAPSASPVAAALAATDRSANIPGDTGNPFATLSWLPPPPPPVAPPPPAPPAAPVAPALPFTFVGMVEKGTATPQAFLSKGDALLIVTAGETIDGGAYRVESMDANQIVVTYLPTKTRQSINLSGGVK